MQLDDIICIFFPFRFILSVTPSKRSSQLPSLVIALLVTFSTSSYSNSPALISMWYISCFISVYCFFSSNLTVYTLEYKLHATEVYLCCLPSYSLFLEHSLSHRMHFINISGIIIIIILKKCACTNRLDQTKITRLGWIGELHRLCRSRAA